MESDRRSQSQAGTSHPLHLEDCIVGLGIQGRKLRSRVKGMKSYKYVKSLAFKGLVHLYSLSDINLLSLSFFFQVHLIMPRSNSFFFCQETSSRWLFS